MNEPNKSHPQHVALSDMKVTIVTTAIMITKTAITTDAMF